MSRVLIIDDEPAICWAFEQALTDAGHMVRTFARAEAALDEFDDVQPDVVLLDVRLPGMNGIDALDRLRQKSAATPMILMTAFGSLDVAVSAIEKGAFDYLPKPFDLDAAIEVVSRALATRSASSASSSGQLPAPAPVPATEIIGRSRAIHEIYRQIALVSQRNVPVLITGESGVGKELVARAIHRSSNSAEGPFIPICIPALSPTLIESELFGHVRGAFTGADRDRTGLLKTADGGTAFLDEIGNMPLPQQVKLLRVLDDWRLTPVGSNVIESTSFRLIAATNRSLEELVEQNLFREDLFYRLNVFPIHIPPLRDRRDDILVLAEYFLRRSSPDRPLTLHESTQAELLGRRWPGNVRELRAALEYAAVVTRGNVVTPDCLPPARLSPADDRDQSAAAIRDRVRRWADERAAAYVSPDVPRPERGLYDEFLHEFGGAVIDAALNVTAGNRTAAAELLGLHRETLRKRLKRSDDGPAC